MGLFINDLLLVNVDVSQALFLEIPRSCDAHGGHCYLFFLLDDFRGLVKFLLDSEIVLLSVVLRLPLA